MPATIFDLDRYWIRRKVFKLLGSSFHVYDGDRVVGYSHQKAFKLREDIRVYDDDSKSTEILHIQARQIIDFSSAYDVVDSVSREKVGAARRRGMRSLFRDSWELLDAEDRPVAKLEEDSTSMALLRRFLAGLIPQSFRLSGPSGTEAAFHQRFNPFVYKLEVSIPERSTLDRRLIFGAAVLIAAIEGRQD